MPLAYHTLRIEKNGPLAMVTLNRPEAANALNTQMALEINDFFDNIAHTPGESRVLIITGEGGHFCAGADLKERRGMAVEAWRMQHHDFEQALLSILRCPLPVLAAVGGAAFAGGLELAMACDFIYAADTARFALTEVTLGIMPGLGGTQHLPRAAGMRRAKEYLFTGSEFSAAQALEWGLVNRMCDAKKLRQEVEDCALAIAANAPLSVRAIKKAVNEGCGQPLHEALACELKYYHSLIDSADRREGINAFHEKRRANFTGA